MTNELSNEQAIRELKAMREHIEPYMSIVGLTAYDMAIKALDSWKKYSEKLWQQAYDRGVKDGILFTMDKECEDCVSRQAVDKLSRDLVHTTRDKADFLCNFWEGLRKLPPITPSRPRGKWIFREDMGHQYCCSECGCPKPFVNDYYYKKIIGCPYCLADMRGDTDETN